MVIKERIHYLLAVIATIIICVWSVMAQAQTTQQNGTTDHTIRVLKGVDNDITKENAIALLKEEAEYFHDCTAMNAIGLAYLSGNGVKKDTLLALEWLTNAGEAGYLWAWNNLGRMYKDCRGGVKQDFCKATDYFRRGAEKGSVMCSYAYGYMLYKGLGVSQNYPLAVEMFERGIAKRYTPSLYMLGLCYRNGYGVEQDEKRAIEFLEQASTLGYSAATEELLRPNAENYMHESFSASEVPSTMPNISPEVNDISLLGGTYEGYVIMYDWSGKFILGEKPVILSVAKEAHGGLTGIMTLGKDSILFDATICGDGRMTFTTGKVKLNERYTVGKKATYRLDTAVLDIWQGELQGRLALYSLSQKEPERPMYIRLYHENYDREKIVDECFTKIRVSPNPFRDVLKASFKLAKESETSIRIFDTNGNCVYCKPLGMLNKGEHTTVISPSIKDGTYVLNVKAGEQALRTIIVKKEAQ